MTLYEPCYPGASHGCELSVQESQLQFLVSSWHTHQVCDRRAAGYYRLSDVEKQTSVQLGTEHTLYLRL